MVAMSHLIPRTPRELRDIQPSENEYGWLFTPLQIPDHNLRLLFNENEQMMLYQLYQNQT